MAIRVTLHVVTYLPASIFLLQLCFPFLTCQNRIHVFGLFQNTFSSGDNHWAPSQLITIEHSAFKALFYTDPTITGVTSARWPFSLLAFVKLKGH